MGTPIYSNHYKYQSITKQLNLSSDTIKAILVKEGFTFDPDTREKFLNLKASSGSLTVTFSNTSKTLTRTGGSFITDGFVVGGLITTTSSNNPGPFTITALTATVVTVAETVVDETAAVTINSADELSTGNGYTQDTKTLAGVTVTEDDTNDRMEMTCNDIVWTAAGGNIGPTPGMILYDDTSSDDTVIGYFPFDTLVTVNDGSSLKVKNLKIRDS